MKTRLILLLVLILFTQQAYADDISNLDGADWLRYPEDEKVFFLMGFLWGTGYISEDIISKDTAFVCDPKKFGEQKVALLFSSLFHSKPTKKTTYTKEEIYCILVYRDYGMMLQYDVSGVKAGQFLDGLNLFYTDFKNRQVKIADAVFYVRKQIRGAESVELDAVLLWLRDGKSDINKLRYKNKNATPTLATFP